MRILLPVVLLAAISGAAYLILRDDAVPSADGTGPAAAQAATSEARPALDLARGEQAGTARASAAPATDGEALAGGSAPSPTGTPELAAVPLVPEPVLESGATVDLVGTTAAPGGDQGFALKYRDASRAERLQAAETLRTTLAIQATSSDKDVQAQFPVLKAELGWLESNLDG